MFPSRPRKVLFATIAHNPSTNSNYDKVEGYANKTSHDMLDLHLGSSRWSLWSSLLATRLHLQHYGYWLRLHHGLVEWVLSPFRNHQSVSLPCLSVCPRGVFHSDIWQYWLWRTFPLSCGWICCETSRCKEGVVERAFLGRLWVLNLGWSQEGLELGLCWETSTWHWSFLIRGQLKKTDPWVLREYICIAIVSLDGCVELLLPCCHTLSCLRQWLHNLTAQTKKMLSELLWVWQSSNLVDIVLGDPPSRPTKPMICPSALTYGEIRDETRNHWKLMTSRWSRPEARQRDGQPELNRFILLHLWT